MCSAATAACTAALSDGGDGGGGGGGLGGGSSAGATDVPCDVETVLSDNCLTCHAGSNPAAGVSLASYASLTGPSPSYPSQSVAQRALARMTDPVYPMPPSGAPPADQVAVFKAWVDAGTPMGSCGSTAPTDPTKVQCTSNAYWHGEDGADMDPGQACIACHSQGGGGEEDEGGPMLGFAGTIYPSLHEPDDCLSQGIDGATVVVTDANGNVVEVPVRSGSGNFMALETPVAMPINAEIHRNGKVVKMMNPVPTGDCNTCHTVQGANGASGRILAP